MNACNCRYFSEKIIWLHTFCCICVWNIHTKRSWIECNDRVHSLMVIYEAGSGVMISNKFGKITNISSSRNPLRYVTGNSGINQCCWSIRAAQNVQIIPAKSSILLSRYLYLALKLRYHVNQTGFKFTFLTLQPLQNYHVTVISV